MKLSALRGDSTDSPATARRNTIRSFKDRLPDWLIAALLCAGAFTLYLQTLAPTVLIGDGGEFQFVPYVLGVAHPTGYPLYSLLGWAWSHLLPVGDVAYRMNLFSAFWAALAVGLLYPTARALLRQAVSGLPLVSERLVATLAAVIFAVSPTFWSQSVIAEVYSLNAFFVILLFYLLLTWGEQRLARSPQPADAPDREPRLLLVCLCFGLSLAHHRTTLLLAPAFLAYVWLVDRRVFSRRTLLVRGLVLAVLPLSLYLYIPWRAAHTPYFHLPLAEGRELSVYENTLSGLASYILGGAFSGSIDPSVNLAARLSMALQFLRSEVGWAGMALALIGVGRLEIGRRWPALALTATAFLALVLFNLLYTIGDVIVLYIPAFLIVVLWLAVGVATVVESLASLLARAPLFAARIAHIAIVLPFFVLPVWAAIDHYAAIDQSQNTDARTSWKAILAAPLPPDAVLVSNDRNEIMPLWYFQYVGDGQPERPDLLGLFPLITPELPALGQVLDLAQTTSRPVYLIKDMPGLEVKVKTQPQDGLWRVLGPSVEGQPTHVRSAHLADAVSFVGYDQCPPSVRPGETLQVSLYWEALRALGVDYHSYVHLVNSSGQKIAQSDHQPGGVYYPSSLWRPAEQLRDDHRLTVPADVPPGVYRLLVGMYSLAEDGTIGSLGDAVVAGEVAVKTEEQTDPGPTEHPASACQCRPMGAASR